MSAERFCARDGTWLLLSLAAALNSGCENDQILNDKDARAIIKDHLELRAGGPVKVTEIMHAMRKKGRDADYLIVFKVARTEVEPLRQTLLTPRGPEHWQIDDQDHLYTAPSSLGNPDWWKPGELPDLDVLALTQRGEARNRGLSLALSASTGTVYLCVWRT